MIRAEKEDLKSIHDFLEEEWQSMYPTKPFESNYQEDIVLAGTKQTNGNLKKIFLFLTVLGGLLSASGIYSLASLNIAKRTKRRNAAGIRNIGNKTT